MSSVPNRSSHWLRGLICAAIVAPCLAAFGLFAASGTAAIFLGRPLIWAARDVTLSEAIGMRDQGESLRQLMLGADPTRAYDVGGVLREGEQVTLTPLEAAVIVREVYLLDILFDYGAIIDARNTRVLQCLAIGVKAPSIVEYLVERSYRVESCEGVVLPWQP